MLTADNLLPLIVAAGLKPDNIWYTVLITLSALILPWLTKHLSQIQWPNRNAWKHKILIRVDGMDIAGRQSLMMHDTNKHIINGILDELLENGSIKKSRDQEVLLFTNRAKDSDYDMYLDGTMILLPSSPVLYDNQMFEFTKSWDVTTGAEKSGTTMREKVQIIIWTNDVDKTIKFAEMCKNKQVKKYYAKYVADTEDKNALYYYCRSKKRSLITSTEYTFEKYINLSNRSFNSIFFQRKTELIDILENFQNKKGMWNPKSERPYKLNMILHGLPGCGKTSIIKATARLLGRHIIRLSMKNIPTAEDLMDIMCNKYIHYWDGGALLRETIPISKRIYVLEDLDCDGCEHVLQRETKQPLDLVMEIAKKEKTKITVSDLLNILDGPYELHGAMTILTTNNIEKFDPALIRPGRMDVNLELTPMTDKDLREMLVYHYGKAPDQVKIAKGVTPAMIESIVQCSPTLEEFMRRSSTIGPES